MELSSDVIVKEVIDRLDNEVPMVNGAVLLEPIVRKVLDVLAERNFIELLNIGDTK